MDVHNYSQLFRCFNRFTNRNYNQNQIRIHLEHHLQTSYIHIIHPQELNKRVYNRSCAFDKTSISGAT